MRRSVRWSTKTGFPCHFTVTLWPGSMGERSTSTVASARTLAAGFMLSMNGQATAAAPAMPAMVVARTMKSRRLSSGASVSAVSVMASASILPDFTHPGPGLRRPRPTRASRRFEAARRPGRLRARV